MTVIARHARVMAALLLSVSGVSAHAHAASAATPQPEPDRPTTGSMCDIDPQPRWHVPGPMRGTAAVGNGVVFALTRAHEVVAVDAAQGRVLWRASTGSDGESSEGTRVVLAPDLILAGDGAVVALERASGEVRWRFRPSSEDAPGLHLGERHGAVIYAGSLVGRLHAVEVDSGEARWSTPVATSDDTVVFAPRVTGSRVVATFTQPGTPDRGGLVAVEVETGRLAWRVWFPPAEREGPQATWAGGGLAVWQHLVLASAGDGTVHAVDSRTGEWQWSLPPAPWARPPGAPPSVTWSTDDLRGLAVDGDTLIVGSLSGRVTAVDLRSREVRWDVTDPGGGSVALALAATTGLALVPHLSGHLVAFDLDTGRARWRIGHWATGILWPPVVQDGQVVVTGAGLGVVAYACLPVPP